MKQQNHRWFLKEAPHKPQIQCLLTVRQQHKAKDNIRNFSLMKSPRAAWCSERLSCNLKVNRLINANEPVWTEPVPRSKPVVLHIYSIYQKLRLLYMKGTVHTLNCSAIHLDCFCDSCRDLETSSTEASAFLKCNRASWRSACGEQEASPCDSTGYKHQGCPSLPGCNIK